MTRMMSGVARGTPGGRRSAGRENGGNKGP